MAKGDYVLNIGDDNVVLTRLVNNRVVNAWLGSADPAMAQEELGEALAEDPKGRLAVIVDTLDQSFKEEEIPRVGVLDRRKVLARHINMAFPGQNLRGARLVRDNKKTLLYQFASVPLDGRIPGWVDFVESLPNEKGGYYAIAAENVDMLAALAPKDAPVDEGRNHWRHLIGVNVTGGLRQVIEKNGSLALTRLTQAPPAETPPAEFADMIQRDFKATITYIRRLGYQVGEPLDLVILTTAENQAVMEDLSWDGARSVTIYTPQQAGAALGLGSIGREDQAFSDVLHAAWFASKRKPKLPLTRSLAMGDIKDDLRDLAFVAAPYAAAIAAVSVIGWAGWTGYQFWQFQQLNQTLDTQLAQVNARAEAEAANVGKLQYDPKKVRNVIEVAAALDMGRIDVMPVLTGIAQVLQNDATLEHLRFSVGSSPAPGTPANAERAEYVVTMRMQLAKVVTTANEALTVARRLESRLNTAFAQAGGYKVQMTAEPGAAQATDSFRGGLLGVEENVTADRSDEPFYTEFRIVKAAK